ncbi:MAG: amidohydrolase [Deltaproteobacteria bacterium]|nr:amidohydrolase [Deltaproteobacteria bacterium]
MKIDIFPHILPKKYLAAFRTKVKSGSEFNPRVLKNKAVSEIDLRLRLMDRYPDVIQVLTVSLPPLESLVTPSDAVELAMMANDELADLVDKYPDKFIAAVACLPLNDMDAALKEADRAITQLGFRGVQIFTNIDGEPLDLPKFRTLYEKMAYYDLPIWIHPYEDDKRRVPVFGYPYETTLAMARLVSAGIFQDYPDIKFITHHCGGMVPFIEQRIRWLLPLQKREGQVPSTIDHFRKFYNDTAVYGSTAALMCGYEFFGADHMLFGTDMPLGPDYGLTMETIRSVENMEVPDYDKEKIFKQNAIRLLRIAT